MRRCIGDERRGYEDKEKKKKYRDWSQRDGD
jgi:hypothetical protein